MLDISDIGSDGFYRTILRKGFAHGFFAVFGGVGFSHAHVRREREAHRRGRPRAATRARVIQLDLGARCAALGFTQQQADAYLQQIVGHWNTEMTLRAVLAHCYLTAATVGMITALLLGLSLVCAVGLLAIYVNRGVGLLPGGIYVALFVFGHRRINRYRDFEEAMYRRFLDTSP